MSNPKNIRAAADALAKATEARDRIAAAVETYRAADLAAPSSAEIERLTLEHEQAAARHALGEASPAEAKAAAQALADAHAAVKSARERADASAVTLRGLDGRLAEADGAVAEAAAVLEAARVAWLRAELAAAEADYLAAAPAVAAAFARHRAIVAAMRYRQGAQLTNVESMAAPLVLPVIGETSARMFAAARPTEPHAVAKDIAPVIVQPVDVVAELAEIEAPRPGILARAARALASNGTAPAPAGAAA